MVVPNPDASETGVNEKASMDRLTKSVGKGKDKIVNGHPELTEDLPKSLVERISTSAVGLTRDALLQPNTSAVTHVLAPFATNAAKGASSSNSAASTASFSAFDSSSSRLTSTDRVVKQPTTEAIGVGFRSTSAHHKGSPLDISPFELDAFLSGHDPTFSAEPSDAASQERHPFWTPKQDEHYRLEVNEASTNLHRIPSGYGTTPSVKHLHPSSDKAPLGFEHRDAIPSFPGGVPPMTEGLTSGLAEHSTREMNHPDDGAAVVALISKPGNPAEDESVEILSEIARKRSNPQGWVLRGASDLKLARALDNTVDRQLMLVPDFVSSLSDPRAAADAMPRAEEQARIAALKPWLDILDSYQDEVWGDLLPLVQLAREELESARPDDTLDVKPAVRRLQMLLGHLDPRDTSRNL